MLRDMIFIVVGGGIGIMNAIAGGGMLVGFPVLIAFGVPPLIANATGNLITAPGQLTSAYGYRSYLARVPKRYALLLFPTIIGSILGASFLRRTSAAHFAHIVPLLVLFGVGLFTFQPLLHFHLHRHLKNRRTTWLPLIFIGLGVLPVAFYGGYFGAGYGFMMIAFLGLTNLHDTHMINAMKNVSAIGVSISAIICLYSAHLFNLRVGIPMAIGCSIGGYVGAKVAQRVSSHALRIVIIVIGLAAALYLGLQSY
jgi:uncharacterized membrane protein YfcA